MPLSPPFLLGVNLPWVRYGDFGSNAWHPAGGLSTFRELPAIAARLQEARDAGAAAVRWFLFCDGRAGIRFDADGVPLGLDATLVRDVETALALVAEAGLQAVPVLLDFTWCARRRVTHGVQLGGRVSVLRRPGARAALLDRVVAPLLDRFGRDERILAWDVFNEPEWVTFGVGTARPWRSLSRSAMRAVLGSLVAGVHAHTRHLATVGSASARWIDLVRDLDLDVYQPHWYDHLEPAAPLEAPLADRALDRPAWLGEFPTRAGRHTAATACEAARRAGYAGAFAWSLLADDRESRFTEAAPLLAEWAAALDRDLHGRGSSADRHDPLSTAARQDRVAERQDS